MDFTLKIYRRLIETLQSEGYSFITFEDYCLGKIPERFVMLRHDVDLRAGHSYITAKIEAALGIRASYYFRVVPQSNRPDIIRAIAQLGHEIGYHYEDMSLFNGNAEKSLAHFQQQLAYFRNFYPVKTISMHGSPTSKYDNKDLWKSSNYKDYGVIGEPYFDVDFTKVFYLTDTGRMWNGDRYSVRDKVKSNRIKDYRTTKQLIKAVESGFFPPMVMITTHPQRWTNNPVEWFVEFMIQGIKNKMKWLLIKKNTNKAKSI